MDEQRKRHDPKKKDAAPSVGEASPRHEGCQPEGQTTQYGESDPRDPQVQMKGEVVRVALVPRGEGPLREQEKLDCGQNQDETSNEAKDPRPSRRLRSPSREGCHDGSKPPGPNRILTTQLLPQP